MNRDRNRRSLVGADRARRRQPMRAATPLRRAVRRPPALPATEEAALAFLSDILVGDSAWTMDEVQRLISMREVAELGR